MGDDRSSSWLNGQGSFENPGRDRCLVLDLGVGIPHGRSGIRIRLDRRRSRGTPGDRWHDIAWGGMGPLLPSVPSQHGRTDPTNSHGRPCLDSRCRVRLYLHLQPRPSGRTGYREPDCGGCGHHDRNIHRGRIGGLPPIQLAPRTPSHRARKVPAKRFAGVPRSRGTNRPHDHYRGVPRVRGPALFWSTGLGVRPI